MLHRANFSWGECVSLTVADLHLPHIFVRVACGRWVVCVWVPNSLPAWTRTLKQPWFVPQTYYTHTDTHIYLIYPSSDVQSYARHSFTQSPHHLPDQTNNMRIYTVNIYLYIYIYKLRGKMNIVVSKIGGALALRSMRI